MTRVDRRGHRPGLGARRRGRHSITKAALAAGIGGWAYARRVIIGLALVLAAAWAGAALAFA